VGDRQKNGQLQPYDQAACGEPIPPAARLDPTDAQLTANLAIAQPIGGQQHDTRPPHRPNVQCLRSHPTLQFCASSVSLIGVPRFIIRSVDNKRTTYTQISGSKN
jgi:hypothetical protein